MPIQLHIFEERYKQMINLCLDETRPFGVALIKQGHEVGAAAEPQPMGCTAEIAQVQRLEDGRMNLVAIGRERFRIASLSHEQPYLTGTVETQPLREGIEETSSLVIKRLRLTLKEYLDVLASVGKFDFDLKQLPPSPSDLAYLAATLIQTPSDKKQALLDIDQLPQLVQSVYDLCRQELAILKVIIATETESQQATDGPFSMN